MRHCARLHAESRPVQGAAVARRRDVLSTDACFIADSTEPGVESIPQAALAARCASIGRRRADGWDGGRSGAGRGSVRGVRSSLCTLRLSPRCATTNSWIVAVLSKRVTHSARATLSEPRSATPRAALGQTEL